MRRKAIAQTAPATLEQATAMIDGYAALSADIAAIEAERAVRRAEVDKDCDERIGYRAAQMANMFAELKAWWAVAGADVAKGKRSAEIGPVAIGIRKTPSALKMKGSAKANIEALLRAGFARYLKVKHSLDKEAIKRELAQQTKPLDAPRLTEMGFSINSKDEFFIQPLAEAKGDVEVSS